MQIFLIRHGESMNNAINEIIKKEKSYQEMR